MCSWSDHETCESIQEKNALKHYSRSINTAFSKLYSILHSNFRVSRFDWNVIIVTRDRLDISDQPSFSLLNINVSVPVTCFIMTIQLQGNFLGV